MAWHAISSEAGGRQNERPGNMASASGMGQRERREEDENRGKEEIYSPTSERYRHEIKDEG